MPDHRLQRTRESYEAQWRDGVAEILTHPASTHEPCQHEQREVRKDALGTWCQRCGLELIWRMAPGGERWVPKA